MNFAFDVFLKVEDREWPMGQVALPAGSGSHGFAFGGQIEGLESKSVDVVLRTSPAAAERTVDLYEIWGGDVVIEGVELVWPEQ